jgi:hypothetical protein
MNLVDPATGMPRQVANTAAPLPTPFASPGSAMMNSFNQALAAAGSPTARAAVGGGGGGLIPGTTSVPQGPAGYPPGQYPLAGYPYQLQPA